MSIWTKHGYMRPRDLAMFAQGARCGHLERDPTVYCIEAALNARSDFGNRAEVGAWADGYCAGRAAALDGSDLPDHIRDWPLPEGGAL